MREDEYLKNIFAEFKVSKELEKIIRATIKMPVKKRCEILNNLRIILKRKGLSLALLTLFRQQVNCGFVLGDPLIKREERIIEDRRTGIKFILAWNPDRELRKNHKLLIERGVISKSPDKRKLVNFDSDGKPCYLCWKNILEQNPSEIIFKIKLANEYFYAGANFANITNNHFTIMNSKHIPQLFRVKIIDFMSSFLKKTNGYFRIIYNGLAGASIKAHEHLQATTEKFPIEAIKKGRNLSKKDKEVSLYKPIFYIPLFLLESKKPEKIREEAETIIEKWESLSPDHTENLLMTKTGEMFNLYIFLRDSKKLAGSGKVGAMASFEVSGRIVLSVSEGMINERKIFEKGGIEWIESIYNDIKPSEKMIKLLNKELFSKDGGFK